MATSYVPHLRLSFGGTLGDSVQEIWSNTVRFNVIGTPPTREQLETACNALVPVTKAWFQSQSAKIHAEAKLTWIKLNWVGADGKQRDSETVLADVVPPASGQDLTPAPPYYQTFAITLRTRVSRGRGHSGRIFPPMVALNAVSGTPYTTAAAATGMATTFIQFLRDARFAMGEVWQDQGVGLPDPAVFSAGSTTAPVRAPLMNLIISAVVDRVPDVQHRRTNRVPRSEGNTVLLDP